MNKLIGTKPGQAPRNADLGTIAYQNADALGNLTLDSAIIGGRGYSTSGQIDLTITRSVGGGGALKLIGDGYLTGGSHVIFEHTASSGASATTQNISYDGTQIYTNGNFKVSGLTFDTASGNTKTPTGLTMEDYEEGTWTPTINLPGATVSSAGKYTKIGNLVYIAGAFGWSGHSGSAVNVVIGGLPFNGTDTHDAYTRPSAFPEGDLVNMSGLVDNYGHFRVATSQMQGVTVNGSGNTIYMSSANLAATGEFNFSVTYYA